MLIMNLPFFENWKRPFGCDSPRYKNGGVRGKFIKIMLAIWYRKLQDIILKEEKISADFIAFTEIIAIFFNKLFGKLLDNQVKHAVL